MLLPKLTDDERAMLENSCSCPNCSKVRAETFQRYTDLGLRAAHRIETSTPAEQRQLKHLLGIEKEGIEV